MYFIKPITVSPKLGEECLKKDIMKLTFFHKHSIPFFSTKLPNRRIDDYLLKIHSIHFHPSNKQSHNQEIKKIHSISFLPPKQTVKVIKKKMKLKHQYEYVPIFTIEAKLSHKKIKIKRGSQAKIKRDKKNLVSFWNILLRINFLLINFLFYLKNEYKLYGYYCYKKIVI